MEIQFKTKNDKQLEASQYWIDSETEEILYGGAKGGGKSFLGASLIFGDALIYPETSYFIARKELIDLTNFTIPTIHKVFKNWNLNINDYTSYNGQSHCYNLFNGSKVYLIACKEEPSDPLFERFGSMEMTRGWIEEAGEVEENAKSNLWISIGRVNNDRYGLKKKMLITANPKKGWMKKEFVDMFDKGILPKTRKYIQAFAQDNKYLSSDYIKSLSEIKNNVARQRLFEGNWDYEDDKDSLINSDSLSDAFSNTIVKDGQKYMTVDVARKGKDSTVISLWNGLELYRVEQYEKQSTDITEQKIKDIASAEHIPFSHIIIDEDGIGGGIVDHLKGVKGFTANSSPIPTLAQIREKQNKVHNFLETRIIYSNLKAQCGWKLAELINENGITFKVPEYREKIIEELSAILRDRSVDGEGKKQLIEKAEVKKEIKRSPDLGDTVLMRCYFELKKGVSVYEDSEVEAIKVKLEDQFAMRRHQIKNSGTK